MTCESCFFWYHDNHFGSCKRFPKVEVKNKNDWCGEFRQKIVTVPLPVYTEDDLKFVSAETSEEVGEIITKKRGRPAKGNK
jgi:hypothetical protein